ncbi:MAG TPA: hypothetical protein VD970_15830 [Acetobacteraceae bacterium]|nr:hypothetical protein [Acetobacteraceae bacterium]
MRFHFAGLGLLAALGGVPVPDAMAQRAGSYAVEGQAPDGSRYEGAAQFQPTGPQTWRVTWRVAGETMSGIGITAGNVLSVAFTMQRELGAAVYEIQPDGTLRGRWTAGPNGGVGSERLLPR